MEVVQPEVFRYQQLACIQLKLLHQIFVFIDYLTPKLSKILIPNNLRPYIIYTYS